MHMSGVCIMEIPIFSLRVDISRMAVENNALNLGQGFPDFMAPETIVSCLKEVANDNNPLLHQYTRSYVSDTKRAAVVSDVAEIVDLWVVGREGVGRISHNVLMFAGSGFTCGSRTPGRSTFVFYLNDA